MLIIPSRSPLERVFGHVVFFIRAVYENKTRFKFLNCYYFLHSSEVDRYTTRVPTEHRGRHYKSEIPAGRVSTSNPIIRLGEYITHNFSIKQVVCTHSHTCINTIPGRGKKWCDRISLVHRSGPLCKTRRDYCRRIRLRHTRCSNDLFPRSVKYSFSQINSRKPREKTFSVVSRCFFTFFVPSVQITRTTTKNTECCFAKEKK